MSHLVFRARVPHVATPFLLAALLCVTAAPLRPLWSQARTSGGAAAPPPGAMQGPPQGPPVPTTFEGLFAERDLRARGVLQYTQCQQETMQAVRSGAVGDVSPSWTIACIPQGNEWRGVVVEMTSGVVGEPGVRVQRQWALRGRGMAVRDRVDTAAASSVAYAMMRAMSVPRPGRGVADFMPVALVHSGYSEIWFLPALGRTSRPVVGGDSVIQMKQDGTSELGHSRSTPPIRTLTAPLPNTPWTIVSSEDRLPLISEIVAARRALAVAGEVRLRTKAYDSVLRRTGDWTHQLRAGATP